MKMPSPRPYEIQLASLVKLVQSNTFQGDQVTEILKSGNEQDIRQMLMNFGNPGTEWEPITTALPWTPWQIDQAVADLNMIQPSGVTTSARFWAW